ncbi:hypothetical protein HPP92_027951 [Vanilla planifolia]|uniref:Glycosyl transferase family 51 domain-containing protein n=1 Tax=Vanilla planifolia TaxID=51239 RepID=A0A835P9Y2_VANPL|nr:hypothetical protein HPP92_027951 [Vanilla planifolia]
MQEFPVLERSSGILRFGCGSSRFKCRPLFSLISFPLCSFSAMSLLSHVPSFSVSGGRPSRLQTLTNTTLQRATLVHTHCRRRSQVFCLFRRFSMPSIQQSEFPTSSFRRFDPISFLLDGSLDLFVLFSLLPPDSPKRLQLLEEIPEEEAEDWLARLPFHLIQAVTAAEDQRFFSHYGIDPFGIARAVFQYPNGGGGSTITQQLVKRVFLTSERKLSRKFVEGILSVLIEKRISKWKILYSYFKKMYWGHGIYGIESASQFYFGKSSTSLTVGESAMLAGILPAPEYLSPLRNPKRAKSCQMKVLKRMVSSGFLDMVAALKIAREPFYLSSGKCY